MASSKSKKVTAGQGTTKKINTGKGQPPRTETMVLEGDYLTTNQGLRISDNHNSLKAGVRGPSLLEDFVLREKITSFDHERIPERVVHARGAGAFGVFKCTKNMSQYTSAGFLGEVGKETPMLLRFSTVAGSRGSADTARDVRGFAAKFYTDEGNYDLVGNNMPVFFIQDAMKFPDLVHAVKPEPHNEIPQASSAHDTFWDFISLMPESTHMIFWTMSDRAIPRSYRMMEGFGVHTFRFVNAKGEGTFVKFHWKPRLGIHGLVWEEAQLLMGMDSDFHRRDLYEAIDRGSFPEWDLGVQLVPEADENKFYFDLLDPTKLVPEELVPVTLIGRLTLNRNPENFFSEIEQAVFHPGHLVQGIDLTNDPLLQGRLFSYTDTQLTRLGGPNFHEIPVNRPLAAVNNHQRDGFHRQAIPKGRVSYEPNSLAGGCPFHAPERVKAFVHATERMEGHKVRARSESFGDHFSQAKLFFDSQTEAEQDHIRKAFVFELSKVGVVEVRERMLQTLMMVDEDLTKAIAKGLGMKPPQAGVHQATPTDPANSPVPLNRSSEAAFEEQAEMATKPKKTSSPKISNALSMVLSSPKSVDTRKVAFLVNAKSDIAVVTVCREGLEAAGAVVEIVAEGLGELAFKTTKLQPHKSLSSTPSVVYDGVICFAPINGYSDPENLANASKFISQAVRHCKTVAADNLGARIVSETISVFGDAELPGVIFTKSKGSGNEKQKQEALSSKFIAALGFHRHWSRAELLKAHF